MQATSGQEAPGQSAAGEPGTGHAELPAERLLEAYRRMALIRGLAAF